MHRLALRLAILALTAAPVVLVAQSRGATATWPHWRGPGHTGATTANVPLTWSDSSNVRWKVEIPGRGHSTPVASGDRLFLTTAVPTGKKTDIAAGPGGRGGAGGGAGAGEEHRLEVLAVDRASGKIALAAHRDTATPHEGYHHQYGSFASNAPATDGQRVYAFFGSRGLVRLRPEREAAVAEGFRVEDDDAPRVRRGHAAPSCTTAASTCSSITSRKGSSSR